MISNVGTPLLLASDVDETLLTYNQMMNGRLLSVISSLLASNRVKLVIITGNDYINTQRQRVVDPIPSDLRRNLIVYADGCTRKLTFTANGQVLDKAYHSAIQFDQNDKEKVQRVLRHKVKEWCQRYPKLSIPDVNIEILDETIQITIGPLGKDGVARRDQLCKRLKQELQTDCTDIQIVPSDVLWAKIRCSAQQYTMIDRLQQKLDQLMEHFAGLSTPMVIDRDEQLAIKPVKPRFRPELAQEIRTLVSGVERQTDKEYNALIGGRATIDIQRDGIDKAFAIKNLQKTLAYHGSILYFGNAFGLDGNDRPVTSVEGVTCLNVGSTKNVPKDVINLGGGPAMTLAYWQGILWALSGQTD